MWQCKKNALMRCSWQLPFKCSQTKHVLYVFDFNFYTCFPKHIKSEAEVTVKWLYLLINTTTFPPCIIDCEAKCAKRIEKMMLVKKKKKKVETSHLSHYAIRLHAFSHLFLSLFFYPLQRGISLDTSSIQLSRLMFSEIHHFTHGALGSRSRCVWE